MRIPDNEYHRRARVQFIYADSLDILNLYEIDDGEFYLHYDPSSTEILVKPETPLKDFLFSIFRSTPKLAQKISKEKTQRRQTLVQLLGETEQKEDMSIEELQALFTTHFGYEQLVIDKTISEELYKDMLVEKLEEEGKTAYSTTMMPFDGRTFFEESNVIRLKHLGHLLDEDDPRFMDYNEEWYVARALTRHRLYDILANYPSIVGKVHEEINLIGDIFSIESPDDAMDQIKNLRFKQAHRRKQVQKRYADLSQKDSELQNYLGLLKIALPYNEDVRLLRSRSFNAFCQHALKQGREPKDLYRKFQLERQSEFAKKYRPEIHGDVMDGTLIEKMNIGGTQVIDREQKHNDNKELTLALEGGVAQ